jgi:hypothetical protein
MLNSFCRRDVLAQARAQAGRLFMLAPDYSFAVTILLALSKWSLIDRPLRVFGMFAEGIGASQMSNRGEAAREFVKEFQASELFKRVPLKVEVPTNYVAETLLLAKERFGSRLADIDIDWTSYFVECWTGLLRLEGNGVSVQADKELYFRVLAQQSAAVQHRVRRAISLSGFRQRLRGRLRKMHRRSGAFRSLATLVHKYRRKTSIIWGQHAGFDNILDCARSLDTWLQPH